MRVHDAGAALVPTALPEILTSTGKTAYYERIALVVVLLAVVNAEVRLHFGLRLYAVLLAGVT